MLHYHISAQPQQHLFEVTLTLTPTTSELTLQMANWTSGSYLIRDYVSRLRHPHVTTGRLIQNDKNTWLLTELTPNVPVSIIWSVFANSPRVHDAQINSDYGFINPAALFLIPEKSYDGDITVTFDGHYQVYTSLTPTSELNQFTAPDLDTLLDCPFTLTGPLAPAQCIDFVVNQIPHRMVITGAPSLNLDMIAHDVTRLCEYIHGFWSGIPFDHYLFHLHLGPGLYGGLEHQNSCVLQKDLYELPGAHESSAPKGYLDFLQLVAHEYFHAWLVKFLRPEVLLPYPLTQSETFTELLWVFEGFTSYYEQLIPYRAGLVDEADFWRSLSERFNGVKHKEGFYRQALSQSSFNAWTQLYKPTDDSPYTQSSYYGKGAVLAFMLDMHIREISHRQCSLDTLLALWFRNAIENPDWRTLPEYGLGELFTRLGFLDISSIIERLTRTQDNRLWNALWQRTLGLVGLTEVLAQSQTHLGARLGLFVKTQAEHPYPVITYTHSGGVAYQAGLFAGDKIIAVSGIEVTPSSLERALLQRAGQSVTISFFRMGQLQSTSFVMPTDAPLELKQLAVEQLTPLGQEWLQGTLFQPE